MSRKMLIDSAFAEEVRIAVVNGNILEEFEYQNNSRKSTKGNIYLAKVTRVEPSLQAAFVDFGSKKHGFLPFSEIHPDYYQIPIADREKLLEELMAVRNAETQKILAEKSKSAESDEPKEGEEAVADDQQPADETVSINQPSIEMSDDEDLSKPDFYKRYKIQEVIKKDQVILVQIEKEERGNKGAAITTYMSLAGRYGVYMPNATKGGGVSRKIGDAEDKSRLKRVAKELTAEMDQGSVIIRTAGAFKTKTEIKKDLSYLRKLWDNIRGHTMKSMAPTFIHEEGDVIKKSIRDIYENSIDEILIEGKESFDAAKEFMELLLPKHVHKVVQYDTKPPLFAKFGIEEKIGELYSPQVSLSSGGYIVINQTEALVAVDVNSGRATSERNVENTAFKTNIEAAATIAKQIRLRDLSGLIVIDFIDMEDSRNRIAVERALRDALSQDKAKIQIGRISAFGLLEMSRQRLRQSFIESNTQICDHCIGRGRIRQLETSAIAILRAVENEISASNRQDEIVVSADSKLISYLLNHKRAEIVKFDMKFDGKIIFENDETAGGDGFYIEHKKVKKDLDSKEALSTVDQASIGSSDDEPREFKKPHHRNADRGPRPERRQHSQQQSQPQHSQPQSPAQQPQSSNSRAGFKFKYKKPQDDSTQRQDPNVQEEMPSDAQPMEREPHNNRRPKHQHPHQSPYPKKSGTGGSRFKRGGQDANVQHNQQRAPNMESDVNDENFETEMANRRKQNQSLLKEIWKKIVD